MKKLLALILAVIMAVGIMPMTAAAKNADDKPTAYGYDETPANSVSVWVTLSNDGYPVKGKDGTIISHLDVKVPYFDLGLYGLEDFYRYETDGGQGHYVNNTVVERPTVLHMYIYLLERYYIGLPENECGKGTSGLLDYSEATDVYYMDNDLAYNSNSENTSFKALYMTGSSTSMYMNNFWGHDENLMYYRNHLYPLMSEGRGSTADYVLLSDGDSIELAMFSNWNFYNHGAFACFGKDTYKLSAGESVEMNVFKYETKSSVQGGSESFVPFNGVDVKLYDSNWKLISSDYTIDENGKLNFTAPQQAGTYYLLGLDSNAKNEDEACIAPASAKIIVEGGSTPEILYGDVNGDGKVDIRDAIRLAKYLARIDVEINIVNADVNGDGKVNIQDLIRLKKYLAKIPLEPCEHTETETAYASKGDGNHTKTVTCKKCGKVISTDDEACTKGEDGKCVHCGYVFPTAGKGEYTITVKVAPTTVNVTFYGDEDGKTALAAEKVADKGVVGEYHVYEVTVPEGMYSYRAVDTEDNQELGGMTFEAPVTAEIGSDGNPIHTEQKMTLVRVNYYTTNKNVKAIGDYSIDIYPGKMKEVVTGAQYINEKEQVVTPTLLHAHGNALLYNWRVNLSEELAKDYGVSPTSNETFGENLTTAKNKTFVLNNLIDYSVAAPKGATVRFFSQIKNFNVEELPVASATENKDGTVTSVLRAPGGNLMYRVSMEGKVTKAGYFGTDKNVTVTFGENEDPKSTENKVNNSALAKSMESSTMVNINEQNELSLGVGETFRLRAYRGAWQIVNTVTGNIMIEPDFNYKVISGGEHIKMTPAANRCTGNAGVGEQTNWMDIEGVSEGIAIIEVSYDAIEIGGSTSAGGIYGATDPKRTSLVVINVGGAKGELSMKAVGAGNEWDTEFDTVYSLENTATLNFNATLDGAEPTVQLSTDKGASWKNVKKNSDGTFTASGLVEGNNILKFTTNGKTAYQVVRAAKVTYTATNQRENAKDIIVGDTVEIKFSGLYQPIAKFSGIYNPGFGEGHKIKYNISENAEFVKASGGQYDFITTNKYIVKAIAKGEVKLTGGNVHFNVMGDPEPLGGHRVLTDNGIGANFNAKSTNHIRDIFPDITIEVKEKER